jgi:hypothetical protein
MIRRKIFASAFFALVSAVFTQQVVADENADTTATTSKWYDVTSIYITNPSFDENSNEGWTVAAVAGSTALNYNAQEFWNGVFNINQTVNIPIGKYRLSCQAYYRVGENSSNAISAYENGTDNVTAYLYANSYEEKIVNIYSQSFDTNLSRGCWSPNVWGGFGTTATYYPNNMASGSAAFEEGAYQNSLVFDVEDSTATTLGIKSLEYNSSNWCMMDNFKLEYYGYIPPVSSITFPVTSINLVVGETYKLEYTVEPETAIFKNVTWSMTKSGIAEVDANGVITGVAEGTTYVRATATDGSETKSKYLVIRVTNAAADKNSLVINEIMQSNVDMFVDPSYNYGGWVELYNPTDQAASLIDLYVSDDANNLKKYHLRKAHGAIPAKGYTCLWFDHSDKYAPTQVDFKLDFGGGTLYISDANGEILASQTYPKAISRVSYARKTDGGDDWGYTGQPTPGSTNNSSSFATKRLDAPVVDTDGQIFTGSLSVSVTIPSGTTLRYTTDGTAPTEESDISTDGQFSVTETTNYRFRLFRDGYLPSAVTTRSYIKKSYSHTLPVISIVTDWDNLYSNELGIQVQGVNGRTGNGQSSKCNWNMDWNRPVSFNYFDENGKQVFSQEVDMSACGGWSRAWTPHSFKLKAAKQYENLNSMDYPFFDEKPYLKHKTLQIRNGGNDNTYRTKDPFIQTIVSRSGIDIDCQSYQPVAHYINGVYKGLINMREPNNKHFATANYGYDTDYMDQFEIGPDSGYTQSVGTEEAFREWYKLSATASTASSYEQICNLVDINEYANYMATEFYLGSTDWPQNNVKGFRSTENGGSKFRFVLYDLDGCFATTSPFTTFENKKNYTFDYIYETGSNITAEIKFVTIFMRMMQNETFRKKFIDSYCLVGGSVFAEQRCKEIIAELRDRIAGELSNSGVGYNYTAYTIYDKFNDNYNKTMTNALKSYSRAALTSNAISCNISSDVEGAAIRYNDIPVPTGAFNGRAFLPVTLKAEAPSGYRFVGWLGEGSGGYTETSLFAMKSTWSYYDKGSLNNTGWYDESYDASSWSTGAAPLGYNSYYGQTTTLNYGSSSSNKRPTYYFRKEVNLSEAPGDGDIFRLQYVIDDGFVVYVNGTEAGRYNMPSGTVTYSTLATSYAVDNPDQGYIDLPANLFKAGTNTIAVEVHNNAVNSTDVLWEASLTRRVPQTEDAAYVSTDTEYTLPEGSDNVTLVAHYEPLTTAEAAEEHALPVRINEVSAANTVFVNEYYKRNDWIELYNTTSTPYDIAGMYISDNHEKQQKYQIPTDGSVNTVIPAYGYILIWCDKLTDVSQLHTTFKLEADGDELILTAADGSWNDYFTYPALTGNQSAGRYPDGSNTSYVMDHPTIAKANLYTDYSVLYAQGEWWSPESTVLKGDVNGDGDVTVADITEVADIIMGAAYGYDAEAADVNGDGEITVADITEIADIILKKEK